MPALLLPILLISYFVMAAIFLVAARGAARRARWLGLGALAAAAPFFFWLGVFSNQFVSGQCYSTSIGMIANSVERTNAPRDLANKLRALPLYGYETVCSDVEAAAQALPNAGAP